MDRKSSSKWIDDSLVQNILLVKLKFFKKKFAFWKKIINLG